jgi:type I restriction enzyme, S subunit
MDYFCQTPLAHLLRSKGFLGYAEKHSNRTNIPKLNRESLLAYETVVPPLAEQRRIAAILDQAEALRAKRCHTLAKLDTLTQSLFFDLFGDPATNPKGWPTTRLGEIGNAQGGLQLSASRSHLPREVPYLRVANVYRDALDLREIKTFRATDAEVDRTLLVVDDLLIVEGHGNPDEIGRCALWDGSLTECSHQNHLIRVRLDRGQVHPVFVTRYLNSAGGRRDLLRAGKTTSGLNTISVSNVRDARLFVPPLPLQREFAAQVSAVERLKASQRASLTKLDALFASLQHCAFRGEL